MSTIVEFTATNVKRLRSVRIVPDAATVIVSGLNEQGKSSVLDAITYALAGTSKLPPMPIRDNGDHAEVVLKLTNGWTVRRTFTPGNSVLKITGADGSTYPSPQALLDELHSKTAFDPLAFMRLEPKEQAATLRRLVGLDFTAEDTERKRLYDERTVVNRRLTEMRGAVASLPSHPDAPATEVSSADVLKQIEVAQAHNAQQVTLTAAITQASSGLNSAASTVTGTRDQIASLERQLVTLRAQLETQVKAQQAADARVKEAQKAAGQFQPIDTTALKASLASAEAVNAKVRANAARAKAVAEGVAKKAESDALTAAIEALDTAKADALKAAEFPVEDLSFEGDQILYQSIPLSQASSAAQQRVSVAIGAALNPALRVMLVRDGSLLDWKNLAAMRATAEELGLQIWIEKVGDGEECSIVMEDGEVRGAEPVALDTPAPAQASRKRTPKAPAASHATPKAPAAGAPLETDNPLLADVPPAGAAF